MENYESTKRLGNFDTVMVERVELNDQGRRTFCGYRITAFQKPEKEGSILIRPGEVTSIMAVIKADQEEERRDFLLRVDLAAIKERHQR